MNSNRYTTVAPNRKQGKNQGSLHPALACAEGRRLDAASTGWSSLVANSAEERGVFVARRRHRSDKSGSRAGGVWYVAWK